jgi:hypothetical protein
MPRHPEILFQKGVSSPKLPGVLQASALVDEPGVDHGSSDTCCC